MPSNSPKIDPNGFIPFEPISFAEDEMLARSAEFRAIMKKRRSVREFSSDPIPMEVVEDAVLTACTAPSGANKQPWHFCLITDSKIKREIRKRAEEEEYKSYTERMSERWLKDLEPLGTDHIKPFLEEAPCLIVVFKKPYDMDGEKKIPNYYVNESVGIATGMLLAALQNVGLSTLTHTPSPMNFLSEILERPENERAYLLIPVGYSKPNTKVPNIKRKPPQDVVSQYF